MKLSRPADTYVLVTGILKGYDQLMNLVLDEVKEIIRGIHCYSYLSTVLTIRR